MNAAEREIVIRPNPKQQAFFESTAKYTAYGGARGGGKSWAMRMKFVLLALTHPGMQLLLLRRTLGELRENHLLPLQELLRGVAQFSASEREFRFPNGARIRLGYCDAESDVLQYQGQAYEVVGLEEATHFTERQFQALTESNRASGHMEERFAPRMYFTCNPGGVGHAWVKRLFIDRRYRPGERAEHYAFIQSLVFDNAFLLERDPGYVETLQALPEARRRAMLYGEWDCFEGAFFPEFDARAHVVRPFELPPEALRFCALDYGLDMTCCLWLAAGPEGRLYVYRELYEPNLILSEAAARIRAMTPAGERVRYTVASPDLWNRRQDSGKSGFEILSQSGVERLKRADNARVPGWRVLREYLAERGEAGPRLQIFQSCGNLIRSLPLLRFDERAAEDAAGTPHEITHAPEALRYAVMSRQPRPVPKRPAFRPDPYSFGPPPAREEDDYGAFLEY